MAPAEVARRMSEMLTELRALSAKMDTRFEGLDPKFLARNEYKANQETALEIRRSLAEEVTLKVNEVGVRVSALEARAKARAGVIASAMVALIVAVIAAGLTKGFGL